MIGLAFSGGKDSWSTLHLYADRLDEIIVLWVNTGKNYPEALDSIKQARDMCPMFYEMRSDRDAQNGLYGLPSDIIPFANTNFGQKITGIKEVSVQSYFQCCYDNVSKPLLDKCKELGITELISGKRDSEGHVSSHKDGDVIDGIKQIHPIDNWSSQQVMDYLATKMDIPEHFHFNHSSLDCYDCTAYREVTKDIFEWSKKYPDLHDKKVIRIKQLKTVLTDAMEHQQWT